MCQLPSQSSHSIMSSERTRALTMQPILSWNKSQALPGTKSKTVPKEEDAVMLILYVNLGPVSLENPNSNAYGRTG